MLSSKHSDDTNILAALHRTHAIIEFSVDGTIQRANELFCKTMGYSEKEIIGKHHSLFVPDEYKTSSEYASFWKNLAAGNADHQQYQRIAKGGRTVWIEASYNPVLRKGVPYKVVKIATDITAEKTKSLQNSGLMDAIDRSQAVISFQPDGTILEANDNFLSAVGYSIEEIRGHHHAMFCDSAYTKSAEYKEFWETLRSGQFIASEFERIGKGGKRVYIQASYNPTFDERGKVTGVVKLATDVTERVENVRLLAGAMRALAEGDLTHSISETFVPALQQLRDDYNDTLVQLRELVGETQSNANSISSSSQEVRIACDDLAKRSEQAAASIERTAAALEETSTNVENASSQAQEAADLAMRTRKNAMESGEVVKSAITAMGQIEESSSKVADIIGIIDEIAFQTGLLALNAGVEAARAGEAGRGFAVVAQEVRELAQRSSTAAKEIKGLVGTSVEQVDSGVALVNQAGEALQQIVAQIEEIDERISSITEGSKEQAVGLREISRSVNQVDENAQQNAAMVEEMTAASHSLASDAEKTQSLIGRFNLGEEGARSSKMTPASSLQDVSKKLQAAA
ncbi:methyl-accepting chemotaxis protein [Notoacmeibacter sp. MSK16QG-6]|uniref:methyl-accepting chemotaxis protein n=1 Tax=Notoacmeibacter sp. MSK16QG-6 TaxID=2957982 RepID=UPI0020A15D91|nr:methyl-accepting chemotaxis protein [Notoacmeibacter sp. MSK16QG-6]MCP1200890.1 methyl-accepting chemotaxis protein [Notoacmeibacter sp. MSK16QG-6]